MKKKTALLTGIVILLGSLFINLILVTQSGETELTFENIEALAKDESPDTKPKTNCVASGHICIGVDKDGTFGKHPGLKYVANNE